MAVVWPCAIAVDVGGTFTDLVLADRSGQLRVVKVPSVPRDPSQGVLDAVDELSRSLGLSVGDVLSNCRRFVHGSTVATNAVLERKLASVGLITTEGFRDGLEIRRGIRANQWDHRSPWPPVVVPRYRRLGVAGRIDRNGRELEPLDEAGASRALESLADQGVEAVAVSLLHSYANPDHERRVAALARSHWPGDLTVASSDLVPLLGEYERTSTAVINAGLVPRVGGYLRRLADELAARGLSQPLLLMQSNGGTVSLDSLAARPVDLMLSGPAAVGGALRRSISTMSGHERIVAGGPDDSGSTPMISMEIGGTSCDVAVMVDGSVAVIDGLEVGGYHLNIPAVDVHTIGAGGGTLAAVDVGGMLNVGPQGAGADPGPASYRRGGTEPTATDAHLVLGRLRAGRSAGGAIDLDENLAAKAISSRIAEPLGLSVEAAAIGQITILEQHLRQAVETITIERGRDPEAMTLVAAGGAGGLHGSSIARALGCPTLVIPAEAGVFCAVGMLHSDLRRDLSRSLVGRLTDIGRAGLIEALGAEQERADRLTAVDWPPGTRRQSGWHVDLRYPGQLWSVRVPTSPELSVEQIRSGFEAEYQRLYGHVQPDGILEVTGVGVTVHGRPDDGDHEPPVHGDVSPPVHGDTSPPVNRDTSPPVNRDTSPPVNRDTSPPVNRDTSPPVDRSSVDEDEPVQLPVIARRRCWLGREVGWREVPVYDGTVLTPGATLEGPYLIEAATTTVLGLPGDRLVVQPNRDLVVELGHSDPDYSDPDHSATAHQPDPDHSATAHQPDPVRVAMVQARLDHISLQMGWVMTRTARSPIFSQSHDFSCFIANRDGVLVSTADGIPIHTGGGGFAVRAILDAYGPDSADRSIADGDVFLLNDPYTAGGNHLPDWVVARPVFVDGRLLAFCCNRAHQSDIGGGAAGTYNPEATEIYHEGIRLPVLRLAEAGRIRADLWQLLMLNTRTPDLLDGDLRAMLGSTAIGAERVVELARDLGPDRALTAFDDVCGHADRRFRAEIDGLPNGTWRAVEHWDDDCFGPADLNLQLAITVDGDRLTADFTGTDDQIRGFKNSGWVNTWSAVSMALAAFFDPDLPRNEGTFRTVHMIAPEGSIVNAKPPAPMTMNTVIPSHEIIHLVWRCLSQADPSRSLAGWGKNIFGVTAGQDPATPYVMYHWGAAAGGGATPARDGFNQIGHLVALGGLTLPDVEFVEQRYPVRYHRQEFQIDGGGPGQFRGGTGIEYEIDVLGPARWSFRGEGVGEPTGHGTAGGHYGVGGRIELSPLETDGGGPAGNDEPFVAPKYGLAQFGPVRMVARSPGGGGWGDPAQRDRDAVARDLLDGVVSPAAARQIYQWDGPEPEEAGQAR